MQLSKCNVPHFPTVCKRKFRFCKKMREKRSHFPGKNPAAAKKHRQPLRGCRCGAALSVGLRWRSGRLLIPVDVFAGLQRHMTLFQLPVGEVLYQRLQAGEDGDAQEHSQHPGKAAAHGDGHHHPEAGDAGGIAQDLGADDVAVDLLQNDDEHDEDQALLGAHQQDQEGTGRCAQERPKKGIVLVTPTTTPHKGRVGQ